MPHLIIEYSANLEERIAIGDLVRRVHEAALATGVFKLSAVRTRAARRDVYAVADGDKDNSFVAVWVRIAKGRDVETRKRLGKTIFDAVCNHLEKIDHARSLAISLEVQEIDPTAAFRKNNLHTLVKGPVTLEQQ
jgi:5-carboxymethyl-2-hydroxymuconate isomerase